MTRKLQKTLYMTNLFITTLMKLSPTIMFLNLSSGIKIMKLYMHTLKLLMYGVYNFIVADLKGKKKCMIKVQLTQR